MLIPQKQIYFFTFFVESLFFVEMVLSMLHVITVILVALVLFKSVDAHGRWKCPLPRDELDDNSVHIEFDNTGNKNGACGPTSGKWGYGTVTTLRPGWVTLTWEESISHTG